MTPVYEIKAEVSNNTGWRVQQLGTITVSRFSPAFKGLWTVCHDKSILIRRNAGILAQLYLHDSQRCRRPVLHAGFDQSRADGVGGI